jgi:hypothetical protein
MHVEHIDPQGGDLPDNLALSCSNCNLSKAKATSVADPDTGQIVPLFNPRTQTWAEHFAWTEGGRRIDGKTATGRATLERLGMNRERVIISRDVWIRAGAHPPDIEIDESVAK